MRLEAVEGFEDLDEDMLLEMSNVHGKRVKIDDIDFSFYFSSKYAVSDRHGIRVKICWNREKLSHSLIDGYMELHGEYEYVSAKHPNMSPSKYDIMTARYFFKRYKVLFAAVWEGVLYEDELVQYLIGKTNLHDLISTFDIPSDDYEIIKNATSLKDLEKLVRHYNIFNMND